MEKKQSAFWDNAKPFVFGGMSGITATSCIQPIDTVKVRIQIINEENKRTIGAVQRSTKPFSVGKIVIAEEGVRGLYKGIDAAILRQMLYASPRLGLFKTFSDWHKSHYKENPNLLIKGCYSLAAGGIAAVIGNPGDISLVRFQTDTLLPPEQRRNYKNVFDALGRMIKEEGLFSLWRGCTPTALRAMSLNAGMLSTYGEVKERLNKIKGTHDDASTKITSSFIAGIVCSFMSLPFDNLKTKLQRMKAGPDGKLPYKGVIDCMAKSIAREGFFGLWVGIPTYIFRVGPHAIITLLVQDALHAWSTKKSH